MASIPEEARRAFHHPEWAVDETGSSRELIEHVLAHDIKNKAGAAYRRRTAIERRRHLMQTWAASPTTAEATEPSDYSDNNATTEDVDQEAGEAPNVSEPAPSDDATTTVEYTDGNAPCAGGWGIIKDGETNIELSPYSRESGTFKLSANGKITGEGSYTSNDVGNVCFEAGEAHYVMACRGDDAKAVINHENGNRDMGDLYRTKY